MTPTMKTAKSRTFGWAAILLAFAGLGVPTAGAQPGPAPDEFWCPGQPIPRGAMWNMATCHVFHWETGADGTQVAVQGPPPGCGLDPC